MTATPRPVSIRVDDSAAGVPIGGDLVGIFFEDLSYAADGGLYAELVRNRDFAFSDLDQPGWGPLTGWEVRASAGAELVVSTDEPAYPESPVHVVVEIPRADGARLLLTNGGFDRIVVENAARYQLSVHLRRLAGSASGVAARLVSAEGEVLAAATLGPIGDDWSAATVELTASAASTAATLELEFAEPGSVAVDHVSLFPAATFRGRTNGLRADLAEALVELRPRFMRFPGGCVAHGLGLSNMYRWKDTLGPVERRRQNFNLWGYHQSMGLGYLEYFLLCEDLGAKPLPVVAAGVCCQNLPDGAEPIPLEQMGDYIQEVLDLVEWANGPVDSPWGARRAAAGHPEPFGLEYLAIGNEDQQTDVFRDRFTRIHDAVRAAHPEITVIGTVGPNPFGRDYDEGWAFARERRLSMVDEHSYKSPRWFFENLERFDSYDREGPAVYLGEWGSKGNRMINALAEAAYLGALERNGDLVKLASWAPLFAKIGHVHWTPDLIYFDDERVLPTLNYFVQRMHSTASGDEAVAVRVDGAPHVVRAIPGPATASIRGKGATLEVTGARFDEDPAVSLAYRDATTDPEDSTESLLPIATDADDYVLRLAVKVVEGDEGFVVGFGDIAGGEHFALNLGNWRNRHIVLYRRTDGSLDEISDPVRFTAVSGRQYEIEIRVTGRDRRVACLVDGNPICDYRATSAEERRFSATAVRDSASGDLVVKIVNATAEPVAATIALESGPLAGRVEREQLAGEPDAGAPQQEAPFRPVATELVVVDGLVDIPAWSFTTLRKRARTAD